MYNFVVGLMNGMKVRKCTFTHLNSTNRHTYAQQNKHGLTCAHTQSKHRHTYTHRQAHTQTHKNTPKINFFSHVEIAMSGASNGGNKCHESINQGDLLQFLNDANNCLRTRNATLWRSSQATDVVSAPCLFDAPVTHPNGGE